MNPAKKIHSLDDSERQAGPPEQPLSPVEAATFIEGMAAELRLMARNARLDALSYFLEMARIEASTQIERFAEQNSGA